MYLLSSDRLYNDITHTETLIFLLNGKSSLVLNFILVKYLPITNDFFSVMNKI